MQDRDQRRYDRLPRIQTFGRENSADFPAGSKASNLFAKVDQNIADLDAAKAGQTPARVSKSTLLDAIVLDFRNIARTARSIALTENGFSSPYRIPDNSGEFAITTHADALLLLLEDQPTDSPATLADKATLRDRFIAYELPADFVADLRADREAIREANQNNQGENQGGVEDTARIGQILALAADNVQELDAIMHNKYARDPAKLAAWSSASHTERAPQRAKKATTGGTNPAPTP